MRGREKTLNCLTYPASAWKVSKCGISLVRKDSNIWYGLIPRGDFVGRRMVKGFPQALITETAWKASFFMLVPHQFGLHVYRTGLWQDPGRLTPPCPRYPLCQIRFQRKKGNTMSIM